MFAYVTDEDIARWESQGRKDIIEMTAGGGVIWAGDRIMTSSGEYFKECPFLKMNEEGCTCLIYETRPGICASYSPGSSALCPQWDGY